jgi:hypothetical protein
MLAGSSRPIYSKLKNHVEQCYEKNTKCFISNPKEWQYLSEFYKKEYDKRAAIVTEIVLKKNDPLIVDLIMDFSEDSVYIEPAVLKGKVTKI